MQYPVPYLASVSNCQTLSIDLCDALFGVISALFHTIALLAADHI